MKIIQSKLQKCREQTSQEEQAEFRPHEGGTDQYSGVVNWWKKGLGVESKLCSLACSAEGVRT